MVNIMTTKTLDISGKVCPYCLLAVQKAAATLNPMDELVITCDHPPAATTTIPHYAQDIGMGIELKKISPGLWEIRLTRK
jgi:TusA-related sulfurtransferase